jgi:nanoRNase/pAp phosphatase (c-di-AMP/oligoRNAs hydrolase)
MHNNKTKIKLQKLMTVLAGRTRMLIVMQDHPDPDAMAAAVALRRLVNVQTDIRCSLTHGGTIGRGENRALVRYLSLNLLPIETVVLDQFDVVAMVDAQPGTGNQSLSVARYPDIVIDHHPFRKITRQSPFTDVRRHYGATSSILFEYLAEAKVDIDVPLATALLYGIRSDTQDLGREAIAADIAAIERLYPIANKRMLSAIQRGSVPRDYFRVLSIGLRNARQYGAAIITNLGTIDNPDMVGEVADLFLREEQTQWTLCMGFVKKCMVLSLRTSGETPHAEQVIKRIVSRRGTGGGHLTYAGGQIPLKKETKTEALELERLVRRRFLRSLGIQDTKGSYLAQL